MRYMPDMLRLLFLVLPLLSYYTSPAQEYRLERSMTGCPDLPSSLFPLVAEDSAGFVYERKRLIEHLYSEGYLLPEIKAAGSTTGDSVFHYIVDCGMQYKWVRLSPGNLSTRMRGKLVFQQDRFRDEKLDFRAFSGLAEEILTHYEENGHPFAAVKLDSVNIREEGFSASINVSKGPRITIDSVAVKGYDKLPRHFVRYNLGLKKGNPYNERKLRQLEEKIASIEFVSQERPPRVAFEEDRTTVILYLSKSRSNVFDGVIGLNTDQGGGIILTGEVNLRLLNLFHRGEDIFFSWRAPNPDIQNLDAHFSYPFFLGTPVWLESGISLFRQDSSFLNTEFDASARYQLDAGKFIFLEYENRSSNILSGSESEGSEGNFNDFNTRYFSLGLDLREGNDFLLPTRGWNTSLLVGRGRRQTSAGSQTQYKGEVYLEYVRPVLPGNILVGYGRGAGLFGTRIFQNEVYRIGGLKSLRGFNEQSIYAARYAGGGLEYRFMLERYTYLLLFGEWTYIENELSEDLLTNRLTGLGTGISFRTGSGIFTLIYAVGRDSDNPFDFQASKLHFGFVNRF